MWTKPEGFDEQNRWLEQQRAKHLHLLAADNTRTAAKGGTTTAIAAPAPVAAWSEQWDAAAQAHYYYNSATGEAEWEKPAGFDAEAAALAEWEAAGGFDATYAVPSLTEEQPSELWTEYFDEMAQVRASARACACACASACVLSGARAQTAGTRFATALLWLALRTILHSVVSI